MRSKLCIFMMVVCALAFWAGNVFAQQCYGPYPPGVDNLDSGATFGIDMSFTGWPDEVIQLQGPFRVNRLAPARLPDGRCFIPTQIVNMQLTGVSHLFGPVRVTLGQQPSTGQIVQQTAGLDFPADSFFDVFVTIEVTFQGQPTKLVNRDQPVRVRAQLEQIPPPNYTIYKAAPQPVPLYVSDTGQLVAQLIHSAHLPNRTPTLDPRELKRVLENLKLQMEAIDAEIRALKVLLTGSGASRNNSVQFAKPALKKEERVETRTAEPKALTPTEREDKTILTSNQQK